MITTQNLKLLDAKPLSYAHFSVYSAWEQNWGKNAWKAGQTLDRQILFIIFVHSGRHVLCSVCKLKTACLGACSRYLCSTDSKVPHS